jgi:hypothetical protein
MATLKHRIKQAEDRHWLESRKRLLAAFNGRSMADLEFLVAHGYLPEIPIPGTPVDTSEWRGGHLSIGFSAPVDFIADSIVRSAGAAFVEKRCKMLLAWQLGKPRTAICTNRVTFVSRKLPLSVFCSYAHADKRLKNEVKQSLAQVVRDGILREVWSVREITPGMILPR